MLTAACLDDTSVRLAAESLLSHRMRVVSGGCEHLRQGWREVLVKLEFHAALVRMIRSRASSAAYAITAVTSSLRSVG